MGTIKIFFCNNDKYILIELNETGRLYNISIDQNLIEQQKATREMEKGLSHEIKNPLTPMLLSTEFIESQLEDEELINSITSIKRQIFLIQNLYI